MMRFCTKCGAQNEEDAVFCTACGAALKQKEQKAAAAPIPDKHLQAVADRFLDIVGAAEEG